MPPNRRRKCTGYVYESFVAGSAPAVYYCSKMQTTFDVHTWTTARGDSSINERVAEFIELHFSEAISLRHVAAAVGYSASHLTTTIRRSTGLPVTAWIIRRRVIAAQRLLGSGDVTVARACEVAGFSDLSYFTRQFVRYAGITPGQYRAATQPQSANNKIVAWASTHSELASR